MSNSDMRIGLGWFDSFPTAAGDGGYLDASFVGYVLHFCCTSLLRSLGSRIIGWLLLNKARCGKEQVW